MLLKDNDFQTPKKHPNDTMVSPKVCFLLVTKSGLLIGRFELLFIF